jgi:hypothetical protein
MMRRCQGVVQNMADVQECSTITISTRRLKRRKFIFGMWQIWADWWLVGDR